MPSDIRLSSTSSLSVDAMADLFTQSFEGYFMPLKLDARALAALARRDGIDLYLSRWAAVGDRPAGVMFLAVRGGTWRVAAMGVTTANRRTGVGRMLVRHAIDAARAAGARRLELEVIDRNGAAIALYEACGLRRVQRLLGFERCASEDGTVVRQSKAESGLAQRMELTPCDARDVAAAIHRFGEPDLPWQLSAENIAGHAAPAQALCVGEQAWCLLTDPAQAAVTVFSLVVAPLHRRTGLAHRILAALAVRYPGKSWRIPPIVPEGALSEAMIRLGWQRSELGQWRMTIDL